MRSIEAGDEAAVAHALAMHATECTREGGIGGPPRCPGDGKAGNAIPEGSAVHVFPIVTCEFEWRSETESAVAAITYASNRLVTLFRLQRPYFESDVLDLPEMTYAAVFERAGAQATGEKPGFVIGLHEGNITFVDQACGAPTDSFVERITEAGGSVLWVRD